MMWLRFGASGSSSILLLAVVLLAQGPGKPKSGIGRQLST
jgi:hypothetical protein